MRLRCYEQPSHTIKHEYIHTYIRTYIHTYIRAKMYTKALPEVRAAVTLWLLEAQQQVFQRVHEVQTQVTVLQQHLRKQARMC